MREALVVSATLRLYDTREKDLIESFVDDVLDLVELQPNKDALVRHALESRPFYLLDLCEIACRHATMC